MTKTRLERKITARTARVLRAVDQIVKASDPLSNEIRAELANLPAKERTAFIQEAAWAVSELGSYISGAGGAE